MVSVDKVYRTVQDILNIDQRGQLPPSDFNNIASLAQQDLFKQNFFDLAHYQNSRKSTPELVKLIMRRIEVFEKEGVATLVSGNTFSLPDDVYELQTVVANGKEAELISKKNITYKLNSSKFLFVEDLPKYVRLNENIKLYPDTITSGVTIYYLKTPANPAWNSIQIGGNGTPLFNSASSVDFELHESQEDDLIKKILYFAGVSVRAEEVSNAIRVSEVDDQSIEKG